MLKFIFPGLGVILADGQIQHEVPATELPTSREEARRWRLLEQYRWELRNELSALPAYV